jgi:hypothetical protein
MRFVRFEPRIIPQIFPTFQQEIFAFALPYQQKKIKALVPMQIQSAALMFGIFR